jgi:hypothetical protein
MGTLICAGGGLKSCFNGFERVPGPRICTLTAKVTIFILEDGSLSAQVRTEGTECIVSLCVAELPFDGLEAGVTRCCPGNLGW